VAQARSSRSVGDALVHYSLASGSASRGERRPELAKGKRREPAAANDKAADASETEVKAQRKPKTLKPGLY